MKHLALILFLLVLPYAFFAQEIGVNLGLGLRKTFTLNKKSTLDLRQQFQFTPEIKSYNNRYGDFFNEDGFWPVPDRYRDDDELDDDDDDDLPPGAGNGIPNNNGELNDSPKRIKLDWRSTTSFQCNYRFFPWFRSNAGYGLFFNGEEFRHTLRAELDYRPLRHFKGKRKIDLAARVLFQRIGAPEEDDNDEEKMEWRSLLVPRFDAIWNFKKDHTFTLSNALNGGWDEGVFEFDRWRANAALAFMYQKIHRFTLSYQYQQRLVGKKKVTHGVSFGYEVRF
jgi:hypothetical protein